MFEKFWERIWGKGNLPGPRGIPDEAGRYLVVKLRKDPDWVWKQRAVVRPRGEKKGCYDVRVFDESQAATKKVVVRNYNSLDEHPELVLFEGWFDKNTHEAQIVEKKKEKPAA